MADHHAVSLDHGRAVVDHDGPRFGPFISTGGMTRAESGELLDVDAVINDLDNVPLDPEQLRTLAADALAAAAWLEAQR